ncbi:hypothetical protein [Aquimarina sp. RZ0]|uniref:hypothetical protein n=1 Tax=Aquimarina sp. RZ0 TaxID=2607730 RepID=UPI0011F1EE66|nr:hypothetical protein [Aquimarina sp. RZ0]KAA1242792.1 hypothetical protein F0000_23980 [Aquimarina sp. RZ0]
MELSNIEKLLEKYFEGETTLSEEKKLKVYFTGESVPSHLEKYKDLFQFFSDERQVTTVSEVALSTNKNKKIPWYTWVGVAASIGLIVGLFMTNLLPGADSDQPPMLVMEHAEKGEYGTFNDPEIALQETKKALNLVAQFMNEGKRDLVYLNEFNNAKKDLVYLNEFEITKEKLIK